MDIFGNCTIYILLFTRKICIADNPCCVSHLLCFYYFILDPTAGPSAAEDSKWCLDEGSLHENIKKLLVRFCGPSPLVFSDVNALYLANTAPPTAAEW